MSNRYSRQVLCKYLGEVGQAKLRDSSVLLIGCGGLGTAVAESLVRIGIGTLHIVDRDLVEEVNLHRQQLFTEDDIGKPKAVAALDHLRAINQDVTIPTSVVDWGGVTAASYRTGFDLIIDGTDNFETRYLINDHAIVWGIPWVYGGVVGVSGMVMPIIPGKTACFRCLWPEPPPKDDSWKQVGILPPAVQIVAAMQVIEAIKILTGQLDKAELVHLNVWTGQVTRMAVEKSPDCRCKVSNA